MEAEQRRFAISNTPPDHDAGGQKVARRIANLRKIRGLSVPGLAEAAGISKGYLWELENRDQPNPSLSVLNQIATALGTTVADLLDQPAVRAKAEVPETLPPGLEAFLDEQRRHGEPVPEHIARALAQLRMRSVGPRDWAFLFDAIMRTDRSNEK